MGSDGQIVFSTSGSPESRHRDKKLKKRSDSPSRPDPTDGTIRIRRETKGRRGKAVTVAWGFKMPSEEIIAIARNLKQTFGVGGSVKDNAIEIQGDRLDSMMAELSKHGFLVKKSGG